MARSYKISRNLLNNGVEVVVNNKKYPVTYPRQVWNSFPKSLREPFADAVAYVSTWHLGLENVSLVYQFPQPSIEPIFFKILTYSLPMNTYEHVNKTTTSEVLKLLYNSQFNVRFVGESQPIKTTSPVLKNRAALFLSFGKDSLLTYGLARELGIDVMPFFVEEPLNPLENIHKKKLLTAFEKTMKTHVEMFPISVGKIRAQHGLWLGWDIVLSQYMFFLIPYYFSQKIRFVLFGNEQSCNFTLRDSEGYTINTVFEQGSQGVQLLQQLPQQFGLGTVVGSLIEPIHEFFITYILHHRYPALGAFQMSCFSEEAGAKKRRWCGQCEKCAYVYLYLKALGINPQTCRFETDMLTLNKKRLFGVFDDQIIQSAYAATGLGKDEQLLAFYLVYKRGIRAPLVELFKKQHLARVEKIKKKLLAEYSGIHPAPALPSSLKKQVLKIFKEEQVSLLKSLHKII